MADKGKGGALAKYGSFLGPAAGVVVAVLLIAWVVVTDDVREKRQQLERMISDVSTRLASQSPSADLPEFPGTQQTAQALRPDRDGRQLLPRSADELRRYPMNWDVRIEAPEGDFFQRFAGEKDYWTRQDFYDAKDNNPQRVQGEFEDYRKAAVDRLTRQEFEAGPVGDADAQFDARRQRGETLRVEDGEITPQELAEMDFDQNREVSRAEFRRWVAGERARFFDFGEPTNVRASVDPASKEVRLSWDAPQVGELPPDMGYLIERYAPATYNRRVQEFASRLTQYNRQLEEWTRGRDAWLDSVATVNAQGQFDRNGEAHPEGRTVRQVLQVADHDSTYEAVSGRVRPPALTRPTEWEPVNSTPVAGTEYVDNTFDLDVTYIYAVRAVTNSPLRRPLPDQFPAAEDGSRRSELVRQSGRPVYVRDRVVMSWLGAGGEGGTIGLSRWISVRDGERVDWYRISLSLLVTEGSPVGEAYDLRSLRERSAVVESVDGSVSGSAADVLPEGTRIDFATGFTFVGRTGGTLLLSHPRYGSLELTRAMRPDTASVVPSSDGMENPAEVQLMAAGRGGSEATFEVMRWHRVGENWYRVVLLASGVQVGGQVGRQVSLASVGDNVAVFDATGRPVSAQELRGAAFQNEQVDLRAGAYQGLRERVVQLGGEEFDLFATLFLE